jgi:hypothetical protein
MKTHRECPACRASLSDEDLSRQAGACPYCGQRLLARTEIAPDLSDPYAPPASLDRGTVSSHDVPRDFLGKILMAARLLFGQFPLFAALVLTIWIPGHLLINLAIAENPNKADTLAALRLNNLVELVFGPIYAGGILTALAGRMNGTRVFYLEALRAGLHHWGRLFGARFVAGLIVAAGLFAFIVPGIILAVRFALVDEAVVLEGLGATASRQRSRALTAGRRPLIFLACLVSIAMIFGLSIIVATALEAAGWLSNPWVNAGFDCVVDVFAVFFTCLIFLFYWEARQEETQVALSKPLPFDGD